MFYFSSVTGESIVRNKPVRISPSTAAKMLTKNRSNRPLSQVTVARYAKAMEAGEWKVNGDSIRFDESGNLIDGQHRLSACVKSGKPFESYVVTDLPEEAFDTIDQGRPRTMGDVLARRGEQHYTTLAAACRNLWMLETGTVAQSGPDKMRPSHLDDILERHPGIRDAVKYACDTGKRATKGKCLISPSNVAPFFYIFSLSRPNKAKEFWERVVDGIGLTREMPEYHLRKRLMDNRISQSKLQQATIFALVIKSWNLASENKPLKTLKWTESEAFPAIKGFQEAAQREEPDTVKLPKKTA